MNGDKARGLYGMALAAAACLVLLAQAGAVGHVFAESGDMPFITTWETTAPREQVTMWLHGSFTIDWGDGKSERGGAGLFTNWYLEPGIHRVVVHGDLKGFSAYLGTEDRLVSVEQWGDSQWRDLEEAFRGASFVINAADAPDLSWGVYSSTRGYGGSTNIEDMWRGPDVAGMFYGASFDGDISGWDVSNVTDMGGMFADSNFDGDISGWDVSGVRDMAGMFSGTPFNGDISGWDVSKVRDMGGMFHRAPSFNQDISGWDVSKVTDMGYMFDTAASFNGNLSGWDVSRVTDMSGMFWGAGAFNGDVSGWDVSSVTNMRGIFPSIDHPTFGLWLVTLDDHAVTDSDPVVGHLAPIHPTLYHPDPPAFFPAPGQPSTRPALEPPIATIPYKVVHPDDGSFAVADGNVLMLGPTHNLIRGNTYNVAIQVTIPDTASDYTSTLVARPDGSYIESRDYTNSFLVTRQVAVFYGAVMPEGPITLNTQFQNTVAGQLVSLDGTGPWDPDGDQLTYRWSQTGGADVTLSDDASPTPVFIAPDVSVFQMLSFTVEVADDAGGSSEADAFVFVMPAGQ